MAALVLLLLTPSFAGFSDELIRSSIASTAALFLVLSMLVFFAFRKEVLFAYSPISLSLLLVFFSLLLSTFFSFSIEQSIFGFGMETGTVVSFLVLFIMYLASRLYITTKEAVTVLYHVLGGSLLILLTLLFASTFFGSAHMVFDAFDIAVLSGIVLLLAIVRLECMQPTAYSVFLLAAASAGILSGNDRAIEIALFIALFIIALSKWYVARTSSEKATLPYFSGVALILVAVSFLFPAQPLVQENQGVELRPSWEVTRSIVAETMLDSASHALVGTGPNTYLYAWNLYKPEAINATPLWNTNFRNAVGGIPTLFVTLGILGGLAFVLLFGSILYSGFAALRRCVPRNERSVVLMAFAVSVYGLVVFTLQIQSIATLAVLFVCVGILNTFAARHIRIPTPLMVRILLGVLLAGFLFVGAFFVASKTYHVLSFERNLIAFNENGDIEAALAEIACAEEYIDHAVCYRFVAELHRTHIQNIFVDDVPPTDEVARELTARMLSSAERAVLVNEYDYRNWVVLGNVYTQLALMGAQDAWSNGLESYDRAIALSPKNPFLFLLKAQFTYYIGKDEAGARVLVAESLNIKPDYQEALAFLEMLDGI